MMHVVSFVIYLNQMKVGVELWFFGVTNKPNNEGI
jgi:hypothetical protein